MVMNIENSKFLRKMSLNYINNDYNTKYDESYAKRNKNMNYRIALASVITSLLILIWVGILNFQQDTLNYLLGIKVKRISDMSRSSNAYYKQYQVENFSGEILSGDYYENVKKTIFILRARSFAIASAFLQIVLFVLILRVNKIKLQKMFFCILFYMLGFNLHIISGILQSFLKLNSETIFFIVASSIFIRMVIIFNSNINWYFITLSCIINMAFEWGFFYLIHYSLNSKLVYYILVNCLIYLASAVLSYYTDLKSKREFYLLRRNTFDRGYLMNFLYYMSQGYLTLSQNKVLFANKSMDKIVNILLKNEAHSDFPPTDNSFSSYYESIYDPDSADSENEFFISQEYRTNSKIQTRENIERLLEKLIEVNENLPEDILKVFGGDSFPLKKGTFKLAKLYGAMQKSKREQSYVEYSQFENLGIVSIPLIRKHTDSSLETFTHNKNYQVMFRLIRHEDNNEYLEIIFDDITKLVIKEREKAVSSCRAIYLSKVAHEFKNPLTCMIELSASIAAQVEPWNNQLSWDIINKTDRSTLICKNMNYLLNDFSLLSSLKSACKCQNLVECQLCLMQNYCSKCTNCKNCFDVKYENFELKRFLKVLVEAFQRLAVFENKRIFFDIEANEATVNTNKSYLESIVFNILYFAYKRMTGGEMSLSYENSMEGVVFHISDTGPKLDLDYINELMESEGIEESTSYNDTFFEKFNKHFHIYVVICLVKRIGSELFIESSSNKSNYSFTVLNNFPLNSVNRKGTKVSMQTKELMDAISISNSPSTVKKDCSMLFNYDLLNFTNKSPKSESRENSYVISNIEIEEKEIMTKEIELCSLRLKRILIVDDENLIRNGLKRNINKIIKSDLIIDEAEDCFVALDKIYKNYKMNLHYDLMIIDECMPIMKGSTLIAMLKSLMEEGNIYNLPIISHSAYDSPEKRQLILKSGANYICPKPLELHKLKEVLETIFRTTY